MTRQKSTPSKRVKKSTPKNASSLSTEFKPSDLKKDRQDTLRVNSKVKAELKKRGMTLQALLDEAIDEKLKVSVKVGLAG